MAKAIELGGRKFRTFTQSTAEHDKWILGVNHRAGLTNPLMYEDEDPEAFARRLHAEVAASGNAFLILGGLLVQLEMQDLDWTPEIALQTAEFLKKLHDPKDKTKMDVILMVALRDFFERGLSSPRISRSASMAPERQPAGIEGSLE